MSASNMMTLKAVTKRNYRKMPNVIKTLTVDEKKAIMKAFKNMPKNAKKYTAKMEKQAAREEKEREREAIKEEKRDLHMAAKGRAMELSETEKEVLIKVLYKDIYDAVGTISKKNLAKLTEALINKTKNAQLVALIKAGELEK
jgi:hypothetical protein